MKIRALRDYTDNVLRKEIKKGDEYEVSDERGKQILSHPKNLAMLVEIVKKEVEVIEDVKVYKDAHRDINTGELITEPMKESNKENKPKTTTKKKVTKKK